SCIGNKEHNESVVGVVEVTGIELVVVVEELRFRVVGGGNAAVKVGHAQRVTVEHNANNTVNVNGGRRINLDVDGAGAVELVVLPGTLPVRNGFIVGQAGHLIVPHVRLQVHIRALREIRQHDNVQVVGIGEPVLAAHVEQGGNARQPVNVNAHSVGREPDEIRVINGLVSGQRVRVG